MNGVTASTRSQGRFHKFNHLSLVSVPLLLPLLSEFAFALFALPVIVMAFAAPQPLCRTKVNFANVRGNAAKDERRRGA